MIDSTDTSEQDLLREQKATKQKPMRRVYSAPPDDTLCGVQRKPGLHYVRIEEHPAHWGLPSVKRKFLAMGYKIEHQVEGAEIFIMSLPQETYDARQKAAAELAKARRGAIRSEAQKQGLNHFKSEQRAVSIDDLQHRDTFNG